ncbi:MAG: DegT/DnrJ/EryC1/StrS family aminotransferase [Acidobacteriota bacterium]|nr:DegT/DnrJ/EryC1/StrS family aminotransferase [Acidobacteriota bacterium]
MTHEMIPVFDLERAVAAIRSELDRRWSRLLTDRRFVGGDEVQTFERDFSRFLEVSESVGVANGTDALMVALRALGLEPGDEVIVPAFTFIATAASVSWLGGRPVLADVEAGTLNLDPEQVEAKIRDRTVGVIGVHLYGRPFEVDAIRALCDTHDLWLIEDAAQAHGARFDGRRVGSFGDVATWSFYPSKNLGCFGDGGAISGNNGELLERARRLANHGRSRHYFHREVGINSRLDSLQAAVLNCRLPGLEEDNARRREIAARYRSRLDHFDELSFLEDDARAEPVYHQLTIRLDARDALRGHLKERGIGSTVHYPHGLHQQPAFEGLDLEPADYPVATRAAADVLCLPMFPELTTGEVDRVCDAIAEFFSGHRTANALRASPVHAK